MSVERDAMEQRSADPLSQILPPKLHSVCPSYDCTQSIVVSDVNVQENRGKGERIVNCEQ